LNRYSYALNNPIRLFDPTGNYTEYRDDEGNWHAELDEVTVRPNTGIEPAGFFASVTNSVADWFSLSDGSVQNNPINYTDPLGLYDWMDFTGDALNFTAGLGNAVTLGGSTWIAKQFMDSNDAAVLDKAKRCSASFRSGEWASLALGGGRVLYAGAAKLGAVAAADGAAAMVFRNGLKRVMRGPLAASNYRIKTYEELMAKYGSDVAIKAAAGRTNPGLNVLGAGMAVGGAAGLATNSNCGCQ